jgi:Ferritin-like domain
MRLTRRRAFGAALAASLAAPASARAATEGQLLTGLWKREMAARFAYGMVPGELASTLRVHDGRHAAALATELAAVGLGQPKVPQGIADLDSTAEQLARAKGDAVVPAALALEADLIEIYQQALPALRDAKVAMTAATILASHAQHQFMLRAHHGLPDA